MCRLSGELGRYKSFQKDVKFQPGACYVRGLRFLDIYNEYFRQEYSESKKIKIKNADLLHLLTKSAISIGTGIAKLNLYFK